MLNAIRFSCTPSEAHHTLRGLANQIEELSKQNYELVNITTELDTESFYTRLIITLLFKDKEERKPNLWAYKNAI